ncbi:MAG: hypothetical protein KIT84_29370 [Labilithrix sp.]|nr:hypothetical protein [Labilithrix sp.]MCW5815173.1 hypothetical protein [Labilithrix sp.]
MRLLGACAVGGGTLALVAMACGDGGDGGAPAPGPENDAGPPDVAAPIADGGGEVDAAEAGGPAGPITIRTSTPSAPFSRGGPRDATWAAYVDDTGAWVRLEPKTDDGGAEPGRYEIAATTKPSYTVAFACANERRSLVTVLTRESSVTELDVTLAAQCGSDDRVTTNLAGTFSNIPTATGWLDFGYALGGRGSIFITAGGAGDYELVNLVAGTWDLAFGLREDAVAPLTRIAFARDAALAADSSTLNLDFTDAGATPVPKKISLTGLANEQTHITVQYTFGGATSGLEVGPGDDPFGVASAEVTYASVPAASQRPADRYRIAATTVEDELEARGASIDLHDAVDVALELPPALEAPTSSVEGKLVAATLAPRAGAAVYEANVFTRVTNQSSREWRVSISAALVTGTEIELVPPDLSAVAGFDATWLTPLEIERTVTAKAYERPATVGDGTLHRYASKSILVTPE